VTELNTSDGVNKRSYGEQSGGLKTSDGFLKSEVSKQINLYLN